MLCSRGNLGVIILKNLIIMISILTSTAYALRLRVGDRAERFDVEIKKLDLLNEIEKSIILATVKVNNLKTKSIGTAVLLKEESGKFFFITNNHVMKNQKECDQVIITALNNDYKKTKFKCETIITTKSKEDNLDYTIFTLKNSLKVNETFSGRVVGISSLSPMPGDQFITAGFGSKSFNQNKFDISMSNDDDCKMIAGPVELELQDYLMKNTIALGCDASSGDSGSGIFSKKTGKLVALFFGIAKLKRKEKELTTEELNQNIGENNYFRNWTASSWATQLTDLNP